MVIQWFPGHMAKTRRMLTENLSKVDIVVELLDARIPGSSKNPEIDKLVGSKPRIVCFNKSDLADEQNMQCWAEYYRREFPNTSVVFTDSSVGNGISKVKSVALKMMKDKLDASLAKGRLNKTVKLMIVGIPNVGKSSFINRLTKRAISETGDRPGVTKNKQWVRIDKEIELLDTPGILWPKFEDKAVGLNLAFTGAIKDEILDVEELASYLLERIYRSYESNLMERYKLTKDEIEKAVDSVDESMLLCVEGAEALAKGAALLELIGKKRGCIVSGGNVDMNRAASMVLDEFRSGKMGKVSLETP